MSKALATATEKTQATNDKLDALATQFAGLATWMKNMDVSVSTLSTTAAALQLHAEDTAARLRTIESRPPPQPPSPGVLPAASPIGFGTRRPEGNGGDSTPRGHTHEIPGSQRLPPATGSGA